MKRPPAWLKKALFPGGKWAALLAVLGGGGLYLTFGVLGSDHPFAYFAYVLSAYALTVVVAWIVKTAVPALRRAVHSVPLSHRYLTDSYFKVRSGLVLSLFINLCYAVFKLAYAALYVSFWDGALAVYKLLLCAVRFHLIRHVPTGPKDKEIAKELVYYRNTGLSLLASEIPLAVIAMEIVLHGQSYHYSGILIYVVALYVFYSFGLAVSNAIRYRKFHSPVLSAAKALNLTTALVGVFTLETAMLSSFGGEYEFQLMMTAATGGAVWLLVLCVAVYMVVNAGIQRKRLEQTDRRTSQ